MVQFNPNLSVQVSLNQTPAVLGNLSAARHWLPIHAIHSLPSTLAPLWKSPGRKTSFSLLSQKLSAEQVRDCSGAGRYHSSAASILLMLNLQGCSPRGRLFCTGENFAAAKNSLHLLLYWIKGFGNSCLSGWEWELYWGRERLSLSAVSTANPSYHLRLQGGAFDPFTALLCLSCYLPSTKSRADTGRKWSIHSWNSTCKRTIYMEMTTCSYCAQGFLMCWGGKDGTDNSAPA